MAVNFRGVDKQEVIDSIQAFSSWLEGLNVGPITNAALGQWKEKGGLISRLEEAKSGQDMLDVFTEDLAQNGDTSFAYVVADLADPFLYRYPLAEAYQGQEGDESDQQAGLKKYKDAKFTVSRMRDWGAFGLQGVKRGIDPSKPSHAECLSYLQGRFSDDVFQRVTQENFNLSFDEKLFSDPLWMRTTVSFLANANIDLADVEDYIRGYIDDLGMTDHLNSFETEEQDYSYMKPEEGPRVVKSIRMDVTYDLLEIFAEDAFLKPYIDDLSSVESYWAQSHSYARVKVGPKSREEQTAFTRNKANDSLQMRLIHALSMVSNFCKSRGASCDLKALGMRETHESEARKIRYHRSVKPETRRALDDIKKMIPELEAKRNMVKQNKPKGP